VSTVSNVRNAKTQTVIARKQAQSKREVAMSGASTPQAIVFECFECGVPCQIDPKLGINSLPKNMVLISSRL